MHHIRLVFLECMCIWHHARTVKKKKGRCWDSTFQGPWVLSLDCLSVSDRLTFMKQTYVLLAVSVSCFLMGMGFFIRAGLSNTPQAKRKRTTYIAEQVFLVLASLIWGKFLSAFSREIEHTEVFLMCWGHSRRASIDAHERCGLHRCTRGWGPRSRQEAGTPYSEEGHPLVF